MINWTPQQITNSVAIYIDPLNIETNAIRLYTHYLFAHRQYYVLCIIIKHQLQGKLVVVRE